MDDGSKATPRMTVGVDLGDRYSYLCYVDTDSGEVLEESRVRTTPEAFEVRFRAASAHRPRGRHPLALGEPASLEECGREVLVANAPKMRLIYANKRKNDKLDAENLARLARPDRCTE